MATTKPKTTTKRKATSVRVNKKKRGINKLQALAVAAVLAIVGVVVVVFSRADGTPNYQYSWNKYCVSAYGKTSAKEVQGCKNTSAEAMVYRLYRGLLDKEPELEDYKYWTQKLAGDRVKVGELGLVTENVSKLGSDTAFVKALYKNMLYRDAKESELVSWRNKLKATGSKKWSREKMVYAFAITQNAQDKNQGDFNKYATADKTVPVKQTAAEQQRERWSTMRNDYGIPVVQYTDTASASVDQAQAQLTAAKKVASKNVPSLDDLRAIAKYEKTARDSQANAVSAARKASTKAQAAARLYDRAEELANYATDIAGNKVYGISSIKARYASVKTNAVAASEKAGSIQALIAAVSEQYGVAEGKYAAEQRRLAADATAKGGGSEAAGGAGGIDLLGGAGSVQGSTVGVPKKTSCVTESFSMKKSFMSYKNYTLKNSFLSGKKCVVASTSISITPKYKVVTIPKL